MQEWDTLASNPDKMHDMLESFKDPEVQAKAKEMVNDPAYMKAAKKQLERMQAKARDAIPRQLLRFPIVLENPFPETPSRSGAAVVLSASRKVLYRGPISGLRPREWSSP